jgi:TetR/AcrR family transcriptional regulator, regulator of mycofactocin system
MSTVPNRPRTTPTSAKTARPTTRGRYGHSRIELADAAMRCFEAQGFADTTVEQIAAAAGYSERTFFRQFASKEDVVFFDFPDILKPLEDILDRGFETESAWASVCHVLTSNSVTWEAAGARLAQERTRFFHQEPTLYRRYLELASEWEDVIARVLAAERDRSPQHDIYAVTLAGAAMAAARSALKLWLADPQIPLVRHTEQALELIEAGFGLKPR